MQQILDSWGLWPSKEFVAAYKRWFRIHEIESSPVLQWSFGAILFFFFLTFSSWDNSYSITVEAAKTGAAVCWPYFQSCTNLFFLHSLPYGYSETTLYMVLYGIMLLIVYLHVAGHVGRSSCAHDPAPSRREVFRWVRSEL